MRVMERFFLNSENVSEFGRWRTSSLCGIGSRRWPTHPDEKAPSAVQFLHNALAYYRQPRHQGEPAIDGQRRGLSVARVRPGLLPTGYQAQVHSTVSALRPMARPSDSFDRPCVNGPYGFTYQNSDQRTAALEYWNHHYNWHRPHQGIGGATPMSRLNASGGWRCAVG